MEWLWIFSLLVLVRCHLWLWPGRHSPKWSLHGTLGSPKLTVPAEGASNSHGHGGLHAYLSCVLFPGPGGLMLWYFPVGLLQCPLYWPALGDHPGILRGPEYSSTCNCGHSMVCPYFITAARSVMAFSFFSCNSRCLLSHLKLWMALSQVICGTASSGVYLSLSPVLIGCVYALGLLP